MKTIESKCSVCEGVSLTLRKTICVQQGLAEFDISLERNGIHYRVQVSENDVYRYKFLRHIPLGDIDEAEFYKQIRQQIADARFTDEDICYRTDQNGLQKVNGRWMFVFSNGAICDTGFNSKVYSGIEGSYIPPDAVLESDQAKGIIKSLFREFNHNPNVFYPLFLLNLMAITNGFFRMLG